MWHPGIANDSVLDASYFLLAFSVPKQRPIRIFVQSNEAMLMQSMSKRSYFGNACDCKAQSPELSA